MKKRALELSSSLTLILVFYNKFCHNNIANIAATIVLLAGMMSFSKFSMHSNPSKTVSLVPAFY